MAAMAGKRVMPEASRDVGARAMEPAGGSAGRHTSPFSRKPALRGAAECCHALAAAHRSARGATIFTDAATGTARIAPTTPSNAPPTRTDGDRRVAGQLDRLAHDRGLDQVVLGLLVDEDDREHDRGVDRAAGDQREQGHDDGGDRRPDLRNRGRAARRSARAPSARARRRSRRPRRRPCRR